MLLGIWITFLMGTPNEALLNVNPLVNQGVEKQTTLPDPMEISDEMKVFVDASVDEDAGPSRRLQQLVTRIFSRKGLDFQYEDKGTNNAAQAFEKRSGNCVSFSLMFVALSRYAGFDARFQEVNVESSSVHDNAVRGYARHLNVSVTLPSREVEVDFDAFVGQPHVSRTVVPDRVALCHYYNNLGAENLKPSKKEKCYAYLAKALEYEEEFGPLWVNMGICYRLLGKYDDAEQAYLKALELDPTLLTPNLNLAWLYFIQGRAKEAEESFAKAISAKSKNPYYQYNKAVAALQKGDLKKAEKWFKKAVKISSRTSAYYLGLAEVYQKQGNNDATNQNVRKAKKYAFSPWDRARFEDFLANIDTNSSSVASVTSSYDQAANI